MMENKRVGVEHKMVDIHPLAKIGEGVQIESFVTIAADVVIGPGTWIGPHVTIMDGCRIGANCKIFPGAVLGAEPQDLKFDGEETLLVIGDNVTIREYCTLNRGTKANYETKIGSNCLLMAYVHVAHDCIIGDHVILANTVNMGGHVEIDDHAIIGGMTAIHQFVKIGAHAMISGGSLVRKDVPPFVKAAREPLSFVGINSIGLKRRGFTNSDIQLIEDLYDCLYIRSNNTSQSLEIIQKDYPDSDFKTIVVDFIRRSSRGIMKGYHKQTSDGDHTD